MGDEEKKEEKKEGKALGIFLDIIKLAPLRDVIRNVGGRKAGLSVLGVYGIVRIVEATGSAGVGVGLGLACLGIGIAVAGGAIAIAWEKKKESANA